MKKIEDRERINKFGSRDLISTNPENPCGTRVSGGGKFLNAKSTRGLISRILNSKTGESCNTTFAYSVALEKEYYLYENRQTKHALVCLVCMHKNKNRKGGHND